MKKLLLVSFLLAIFLAPNVVKAQATSEATVQYCNIDVDGERVLFVDAYVLVSASGNVQLKATFNLHVPKVSTVNLSDFIPLKGKQKIDLDRVAVQYKLDGKVYHFESIEKIHAIVDDNGIARVVINW